MIKLRQRETWTLVTGLAGFLACCAATLTGYTEVGDVALGTLVGGALALAGVGGWTQVRRAEQRIAEVLSSKPEPKFGFNTDAVSSREVPEDDDFVERGI